MRSLSKSFQTALLATGLGFAGVEGAHALPFINGSVVLSDSITNPGTTTSIVSGLNTFDSGAPSVGTSTGDLAGATLPATANPLTLSPPSGSYSVTVAGDTFTFTVNSLDSHTSEPLTCTASLCGDSATAVIDGTVNDSLSHFAQTAFLGEFAATGNCTGALPGGCTNNVVGGWDVTLVATGSSTIPEPASMVLFGTALLGMGAIVRRRRKNFSG